MLTRLDSGFVLLARGAVARGRERAAAPRGASGSVARSTRRGDSRLTGASCGRVGRPPFLRGTWLQVKCSVGHQPTRVRERVMRRFKTAPSAQRFLDAFSRVGSLFRPERHRLAAAAYRATMRERVATWDEAAGLRAA